MELAIANSHDHDDHQQQQKHASSRTKAKKIFSLETYLAFIASDLNIQNLTVDHLNKILSIHGFKKTKNRKQAGEAVCAFSEFIHPGRSTMKDSSRFSSSAGNKKAMVTLKEAIKDLKLLNWQECSITSIRTISPKDDSSPNPSDIPVAEVAAQMMSLKGNKRCRSPMLAVSSSLASSGSGRSKSGRGSSGCSRSVSGDGLPSTKVPAIGIAKNVRRKRAPMKKILKSDQATPTLTAACST